MTQYEYLSVTIHYTSRHPMYFAHELDKRGAEGWRAFAIMPPFEEGADSGNRDVFFVREKPLDYSINFDTPEGRLRREEIEEIMQRGIFNALQRRGIE